jgi:hypothetical protein
LDAERSSAQGQLGLSRPKAQRLVNIALLYFALGGTPVPTDRLNIDLGTSPCLSWIRSGSGGLNHDASHEIAAAASACGTASGFSLCGMRSSIGRRPRGQ